MYHIWQNYWIILILQAICVIHAFKKGKNNWIYLLIFLPLVGCIAYFFIEILPLLRSGQLGFITDKLFTPGASISDLEKQLRISDTFANRCRLANAHAARGNYDKAAEIYESALTGMYQNDLEVLLQLGRIYFLSEQYDKSILYYEKAAAINHHKFIRPDDELWLGIAYFEQHRDVEAAQALKRHIQFHKTVDAMYYYAAWLQRQGKTEEAKSLLKDILAQSDLIPVQNRQYYRSYIRKAKKLYASL